jgi:hypothetical protein
MPSSSLPSVVAAALAVHMFGGCSDGSAMPPRTIPDFVDRAVVNKTVAAFFKQSSNASFQYAANEDGHTGIMLTTLITPYAGRLIVTNANSPTPEYCSGIVVAKDYFLTAAHCVCTSGSTIFRN